MRVGAKKNALKELETRSPAAADWFEKNCPEEMEYISFGLNEIKIL